MPQLTAEQVERILEACRGHLAELREVFRTGLDCDLRLTTSEPRPYTDGEIAPLDGPGLAVSLVLGEQGVLLLVPEPVPLPAWYRQPGISENNRLQTFAHELSLHVLPADLQADRYSAKAAASLKQFAEQAQIHATASVLPLPVFQPDAAESDPALATLLLIVAADVAGPEIDLADDENMPAAADSDEHSRPPDEADADGYPTAEDGDDTDAVEADFAPPVAARGSAAMGSPLEQMLRAMRILNVPVTVSVRLAERKMPLGQVVALAPGALVPFNKSCEDLLDLFVNNYRYCQGEAIKIGENFGIKIAKVGVTEERKEHIR